MTTQTLWIVVAVVAAVLLIALVLGLVIGRRRRISLREQDSLTTQTGTEVKAPPKGGTYKASGGFAFSSGTLAPPVPEAPVQPAGPSAPEPPTPEPPAPEPPAPDTTGTADEVRTPPEGMPAAGTATEARTPPGGIPTVDQAPTAPVRPVPTPAAPVEAPAGTAPTTDTAPTDTAPTDTAPTDTAPADTAPADTAPTDTARATAAPTTEAAPAIAEPSAPTPTPAPAPPAAEAPAAAPVAPAEEIAPTEGRLERLRGRLARSRSGFGQSLLGLLGAGELDEESWEDVEATLLQADLGPEMTSELVASLRSELATRGVRTPEQARQVLRDVLGAALGPDVDRSVAALPHDGRPAVLLVVGVNGTGKTTTTGKLARVLVANGRHVVLGAADTFRAAAAEQLQTWGERAGAAVVRGAEGADPAAVAFDAVKRGTADGADAVLLDTAGRLHTKTGLMDELGKVKRVVEKQAEVDEVLLVLDATTGQNGLVQARVFGEVVKVTGIVLTKLDGTAKGGIVFRVQRELGVPVKLVGLGEGPDDLAPFEPGAFVDALLT
ncbi:MAG: signal recognition particle-docking protein FtsY [Pseudonocardia sp.]|nr:signal recognition particle-docking protein FtsY [Pseudonocardia sp.]